MFSIAHGMIYRAGFQAGQSAFADTASKIISFDDLSPGWHYGEGGPIAEPVIDTSLTIYWRLQSLNFNETDAFPGAYGEVMVTAYRDDHYIEVTIEADRSIIVHYEQGGVEIYSSPRLSLEKALQTLNEIAILTRSPGTTWNTYASYIHNIMIPIQAKAGSKVWPSKTPLTGVGLLLSNFDVWSGMGAPYANTQGSFTLTASPGTLPSSGYLTNQFYPQEAK